MARCPRKTLVLLLAALGCGDNGVDPENLIDFRGTWAMDVYFVYPPEDLICSLTGLTLSVSQDGKILTGGTVGGSEACSQTGTDWPEIAVGDMTLSGTARENSVLFSLKQASIFEFTFNGSTDGTQFVGTFQGSAFLEPFDIGDVTVAGNWTARRQ